MLARRLKLQNKRSKWKNQYELIDSNSKFHETIRQVFISDPFFSSLKCFQEVPVRALVPSYGPDHYVDWYIDELGTVLELHGAHHYKIVNFGNVSYDEARKNFHNIRYRDNLKKTSLIEAGFEYREISHKDINKITPSYLKNILIYGE